jgi:GT2 family glycosyltransferase
MTEESRTDPRKTDHFLSRTPREQAKMSVTVSVVIACRNAASTLAVQLEALAAQDCPVPWDVVISDNGSTDASVAVAQGYSRRLPGLRIVDSSHRRGAGYARNVGAQATDAALLAFCDADDEVAPGWLAALVAALGSETFVAGRFESTRLNDARVLRSRSLAQHDGLQRSPFGPDLPHAGAGNLGIRRPAFFSVAGFDPTVGHLEDTDLCWRIQLTGVPLVFCPEAVVHVRLRNSLRTMWAQGRLYGAASALLERRYHRTVTIPATTRPTAASLLSLVRAQHSLGGLLWTLGWHVGHRSSASAGGSRAGAAV